MTAGAQTLLLSHNSTVESTAFHPSGNFFVTGTIDGDVSIFALPSGQKLRSTSCSSGVTCVAWDFKGSTIAAASKHQIHLLPLEYK